MTAHLHTMIRPLLAPAAYDLDILLAAACMATEMEVFVAGSATFLPSEGTSM